MPYINQRGATGLKVVLVIACFAIATLVPRWRDVLQAFNYISPTITSITPMSGPPGTVVTIEGFDLSSFIFFQKQDDSSIFAEAEIVSSSDTEVLAVVPDLPPGLYNMYSCADFCDRIDFEIVTESECDPPSHAPISSGGSGLYEVDIENVTFNGKTTVAFNVRPTDLISTVWISIKEINFDPDIVIVEPNSAAASPGFEFAKLKKIPPGQHASFIAEFCRAGEITFDLQYDPWALSITFVEVFSFLIPIEIPITSVDFFIDFGEALLDVPLWNSAMSHYVNAWQIEPGTSFIGTLRHTGTEIFRALADIVRLFNNPQQLTQFLGTLVEFSVVGTVEEIFGVILNVPNLIVEQSVTFIQQGGALGVIEVKLEAQ